MGFERVKYQVNVYVKKTVHEGWYNYLGLENSKKSILNLCEDKLFMKKNCSWRKTVHEDKLFMNWYHYLGLERVKYQVKIYVKKLFRNWYNYLGLKNIKTSSFLKIIDILLFLTLVATWSVAGHLTLGTQVRIPPRPFKRFKLNLRHFIVWES